jgi:hypothetical protein
MIKLATAMERHDTDAEGLGDLLCTLPAAASAPAFSSLGKISAGECRFDFMVIPPNSDIGPLSGALMTACNSSRRLLISINLCTTRKCSIAAEHNNERFKELARIDLTSFQYSSAGSGGTSSITIRQYRLKAPFSVYQSRKAPPARRPPGRGDVDSDRLMGARPTRV